MHIQYCLFARSWIYNYLKETEVYTYSDTINIDSYSKLIKGIHENATNKLQSPIRYTSGLF